VVVLDRRAAQADLVVELAGGQHVLPREAVVALDPPRLADADLGGEGGERGPLVPGDPLDEEADVFQGLAAPLHLAAREELRIRRIYHPAAALLEGGEPGHDRGGHPLDGRDVVRPLAARQVVLAGGGRLGHPPLEALLGQAAAPGEVDVHEAERRGQGLGGRQLPGLLVAEAGEGAQVGVAGRVDEDPPGDPDEAGLRRHDDLVHSPVADDDVLEEGVEEDPHARRGRQLLPDHLEVLGVVGDPGAGAVRVGALHDGAQQAQADDDVVGDAADHLPGRLHRRVEAVEGVEDGGAGAAQEGLLLD